jgi:Spy/CpxP family protein refolding chaperone
MLKVAAAGVAALFVAASTCAFAQDNTTESKVRLSAGEVDSLMDLRIETVKDALQLTSRQEKYWPAIEDAIRTRVKHSVARMENLAQRASALQEGHLYDVVVNRNPIDFMHQRADALAQRSSDLKKLADAWQPLYEILSPEQKRRMALLRLSVLHEVVNRVGGDHGGGFYDDDEDE